MGILSGIFVHRILAYTASIFNIFTVYNFLFKNIYAVYQRIHCTQGGEFDCHLK